MKHKILLATDATTGFDNLIEDMLNLLNKTHQKYVSAFSPDSYQSKKLVIANANAISELDSLVEGYEVEGILEKQAQNRDVDFEWLSDSLNEEKLSSLSTVFDLFILEQAAFQGYDSHLIDELVNAVNCPVLLLPSNWEVENLVVFHDGSMDSVKMVKDFINLFNPKLRDLPLSVLISHPSGTYDVQTEKVFIDYLKLFFNDIGVQLIHGNPLDSLKKSIVYNSNKPFLMLGIEECEVTGKQLLELPTFLFKG